MYYITFAELVSFLSCSFTAGKKWSLQLSSCFLCWNECRLAGVLNSFSQVWLPVNFPVLKLWRYGIILSNSSTDLLLQLQLCQLWGNVSDFKIKCQNKITKWDSVLGLLRSSTHRLDCVAIWWFTIFLLVFFIVILSLPFSVLPFFSL